MASALLLIPAASAFAATQPAKIVFAGEGEGWVKGSEEISNGHVAGGEPRIECHWNGHEIDVGVPSPGKCETTAQEISPGFVGINVNHEATPGSQFGGWKVEEGVATGCEEEEPGAGSCIAIGFGPIKIKATFNAEPLPPENVTPPTISGTAKEGKTLKGNPGVWKNKPETFSRQWLRCNAAGEACSPIAGAEGTEYTLTVEDVGSTIRFKETATNGLGSASAQSAATAVVTGAAAGATEDSKEGEVFGEVPQTTSLESACAEVFLGEFKPGVEKDYENSCLVIATSTGQETSLSAADEGSEAIGHLVNGSYSLAQLLQVQATDTEGLGGVSTGFGTLTPHTLLNWAVPVSADTVKVDFKQPIGKHDPLHNGTYAKTITLTLKQTLP